MWGGTRAMWWPPNSGTCYLLSAWFVLVCQKELKEPRNNIVFFFISTNFHKENLRDESRSCKVCLISSLSWLIPVIIPGEGRKIEMFFRVRKLFNYRFNVDSTSLFVSWAENRAAKEGSEEFSSIDSLKKFSIRGIFPLKFHASGRSDDRNRVMDDKRLTNASPGLFCVPVSSLITRAVGGSYLRR